MIFKTFYTQYGGICGRCLSEFKAGEPAHYEDGVLVIEHDEDYDCEPPGAVVEIGSKPENVCPSCFLVHAGECF